jgi:hypothetical protein
MVKAGINRKADKQAGFNKTRIISTEIEKNNLLPNLVKTGYEIIRRYIQKPVE